MEKEYKRLAEKQCKEKACRIQYCLQGERRSQVLYSNDYERRRYAT